MSLGHREIARSFEFDAGHRVVGHEGKCRFPHGHRYRVEFVLRSHGLDSVGRVVDYGVMKQVLGGLIERVYDHAFLMNRDDDELRNAFSSLKEQRTHYIDGNPTAEVLVRQIYDEARFIIGGEFANTWIERVTLWETPSCSATWSREQAMLPIPVVAP